MGRGYLRPGRRYGGAEARQKRRYGDPGERRERGGEPGGREQHAAKRRAGDGPEVSDRAQPAELDAARPRQLARHRPRGGPECSPGNHERHLADEQHPETMRYHQPKRRQRHHEARGEHDPAAADAVGIDPSPEAERHLNEDRGRQQHADLGVGEALGGGVERHGEPGHPKAEIPAQRGKKEKSVRHAPLWVARVRRRASFRPTVMRMFSLALLMTFASQAVHAGQCVARSGERTAALVELDTSEGCDSCPPADRWLSGLGARGYVPQRVVPLSLHVDYWDYIGWKDPYARRDFSNPQRQLTQLQRNAFVYTPQVMLQGRDFS